MYEYTGLRLMIHEGLQSLLLARALVAVVVVIALALITASFTSRLQSERRIVPYDDTSSTPWIIMKQTIPDFLLHSIPSLLKQTTELLTVRGMVEECVEMDQV